LSQLNLSGSSDQKDEAAVRKDAALRALLTRSPDQVASWIDTNVTDLASAKNVLTRLTQIVAVLARREYNEFRR